MQATPKKFSNCNRNTCQGIRKSTNALKTLTTRNSQAVRFSRFLFSRSLRLLEFIRLHAMIYFHYRTRLTIASAFRLRRAHLSKNCAREVSAANWEGETCLQLHCVNWKRAKNRRLVNKVSSGQAEVRAWLRVSLQSRGFEYPRTFAWFLVKKTAKYLRKWLNQKYENYLILTRWSLESEEILEKIVSRTKVILGTIKIPCKTMSSERDPASTRPIERHLTYTNKSFSTQNDSS